MLQVDRICDKYWVDSTSTVSSRCGSQELLTVRKCLTDRDMAPLMMAESGAEGLDKLFYNEYEEMLERR